MRWFWSISLGLASILIAVGADAQSISVGDKITLMGFQPSDGPPKELTDQYNSLLEDTKIAGVEEPKFFVRPTASLASNDIDLFVRVESPLTCSASGECEIDLYSIRHGTVNRLFSVVANNIAMDDRETTYFKGSMLPVLYTNVTVDGFGQDTGKATQDYKIVIKTRNLGSKSYGAKWEWDGNAYRAVQ